MKGVQCYELFGGIAHKNHTFSFNFHVDCICAMTWRLISHDCLPILMLLHIVLAYLMMFVCIMLFLQILFVFMLCLGLLSHSLFI